LGVPIGSPAFCLEKLKERLSTLLAPLPTVAKLPPQAAFILIRSCINARAAYLARILDLVEVSDVFNTFDGKITEALGRIAWCGPEYSPTLHKLRALPCRFGGLGISDYGGAPGRFACNQSRILVLPFIEKWFSTTLFAQQRISWAHYTLPFEDLPLTGTTSTSTFVPDSDARDILRDTRDRTFREIYNQKIADNLRADAAVLLSNKCGSSGSFLMWRGCATHRSFQCASAEYRNALRRRILAPPSAQDTMAVTLNPCNCGASHDIVSHPTHGQDCRKNEWLFDRRHNCIRDALAALLRSIDPNNFVRREVVLDVGAANPKRMDVILQMGDLTYFIDVGVTNPACVTNLELANHPAATIRANTSGTVEARAALLQLAEARQPVPDIAAMAMETGKRSEYIRGENGTVIPHLGTISQTSFVPFIIESTGRLGPAAYAFLEEIKSKSRNSYSVSQFLSTVSACCALHTSLMIAFSYRALAERENLIFDW
jgi:hypothetical protein